jgi:hypothetical protein
MRSKLTTPLSLAALGLFYALSSSPSFAQTPPFSASTTSRESVRITSIAGTPPFTRTYANLTADSRDLSFQRSDDGRIFLAYSTLDGSVDDLSIGGFSNNLCISNGNYQIYWVDKTAQLPGVCISRNPGNGEQGTEDSLKPLIGGPESSDDAGRYVAFHSLSNNLTTPNLLPGTQHIYIHDRKFEQTWLSLSKCAVAPPDGDSFLWGLSDDGAKVLMSSTATNQIDNLTPTCTDSGSVSDMFIRNGQNCDDAALGECYTSVLYDDYGYHAGANDVELLNANSQNGSMNADQTTVVFDTASTYPVHFNPDIRGFRDIYLSKSNRFKRISEVQIPRCNLLGSLADLKNSEGPANGDSIRPRINGNGVYVVFESTASDLVVNEKDPDMVCSETSGGVTTTYYPHPKSFSYVDTNSVSQVYIYNTTTRKAELVSAAYNSDSAAPLVGGNGASTNAWISRDGHFVIFESQATNLLKDVTTTSVRNVFMWDRILKRTYLVSPGTGGTGLSHNATITHVSPDGLTVAYQTNATNVISPALGSSAIQHVYLAQNSCPLDTDGDQVPDCLDLCPTNNLKTEAGQCGCGTADTDSDSDGIANCLDSCPADPAKQVAGSCGCGIAETDGDGDGTPNCVDACPNDPTKTSSPGACGCGNAETDTDADGSKDCVDECPTNAAKSSTGTCSCAQLKDEPGTCGCNVADTDANGNGTADCVDPTAATVLTAPRFFISRTLGGYQVLARMKQFPGTVTYDSTLTGERGQVGKRSGTRNVATFKVAPGTYTFAYTVSVGSGNSKVTTKRRVDRIRVPGGIVSSTARR